MGAMKLPMPRMRAAAVAVVVSCSMAWASDHWSFQPVEQPAVPEGRAEGWVRNPVDRFILARLEGEGLRPSGEADRGAWLRRVSLDLVGLTPSPEEVDRFVRDPAGDAYERVVDGLLGSRRSLACTRDLRTLTLAAAELTRSPSAFAACGGVR